MSPPLHCERDTERDFEARLRSVAAEPKDTNRNAEGIGRLWDSRDPPRFDTKPTEIELCLALKRLPLSTRIGSHEPCFEMPYARQHKLQAVPLGLSVDPKWDTAPTSLSASSQRSTPALEDVGSDHGCRARPCLGRGALHPRAQHPALLPAGRAAE